MERITIATTHTNATHQHHRNPATTETRQFQKIGLLPRLWVRRAWEVGRRGRLWRRSESPRK
jgi:hypothetical protein